MLLGKGDESDDEDDLSEGHMSSVGTYCSIARSGGEGGILNVHATVKLCSWYSLVRLVHHPQLQEGSFSEVFLVQRNQRSGGFITSKYPSHIIPKFLFEF